MSTIWRADPSRKELRDFGLIVGGVLAVVASVGVYRGQGSAYRYALGGSLLLIALGFIAPRTLALGFRLWMALGAVLGAVMTRVVLTVAFFAVFPLVGLALRLTRRDPLELRWRPDVSTYWREREVSRADHYETPY